MNPLIYGYNNTIRFDIRLDVTVENKKNYLKGKNIHNL